jgi:hypothetical protein
VGTEITEKAFHKMTHCTIRCHQTNWQLVHTYIYKVEHVGSKPLLDHQEVQRNSGEPQAWDLACTGTAAALCLNLSQVSLCDHQGPLPVLTADPEPRS